MARRRSSKHRSRRSRSGTTSFRSVRRGLTSSKLWGALGTLAGVTALVGKSTSTDVAYAQSSGQWNKYKGTEKLQFVLSKFVSRITNGAVVMWSPAGKSTPDWNIGNALNKWSGIGIALTGYEAVSKHWKLRLPGANIATKVGVPLIIGGVVGGILDDPEASGQAVSRSPAYNSPQITQRGGSSTGVNAH